MKKLSVLYHGWGERWHLGTLADNGEELLFEYHADALQQGLELSPRHLKLRAEAYGEFPLYLDRLPGLIADALPDGWGRLLMDKQLRREGKNPASVSVLDRLAFIGDRAMGALAFEPLDDVDIQPHELSLFALAKEINHIVEGDLLAGSCPLRSDSVVGEGSDVLKELAVIGGSPHGARPKALLNYDILTGTVTTDPTGAGTPWLVKFPAHNEHKEVCAIEHLYAKLASDCGIVMPRTKYFELGNSMAAFGIERFDRQSGMRVPMHTLAGLLHSDFRVPSVDYTTFLRATRFLTRNEREVEKAFLRCVFNVIMHNRDDHAKNFSFCLAQDRQWKLSDGFDLTYSAGTGGEHQMDICGEGRNPGRAHLIRLAKESGVNFTYASNTITAVSAVAGKFVQEAKEFEIRKTTVKLINELIKGNLGRMT